MPNLVTFGLEQVHIAFREISQTESIEVTGEPTADGEITITVTAATLLDTDSPHDVVVPLATETHTTEAKMASAIVNALNNDDIISAVFTARNEGAVIYLATKIAQDNDATLEIAFEDTDTTGATMDASTAVATGTTSWGTPEAVEGAVRFSTSPEGSESKFYADNTIYYTHTNNNGYTGELEVALVPDAIVAEMLGLTVDSNGMVVEDSEAEAKEFALMGQVQGDDKNRRFVYYRCKAARINQENETKGESVTPSTEKVSLTILPFKYDGDKLIKGVMELSDTNSAAYNAFFDAVTLPAA
jgi:phi13 family phage major tail protein